MSYPMYVKRLTAAAKLPTRASAQAAGYDLSADFTSHEDPEAAVVLRPGERRLIKTGLSINLPDETYGRVAPRSGLAYKHGIDVMAGVIDADYRGEVGVILINLGAEDFTVNNGDRIAQLVIERIVTLPIEEVRDLSETLRGDGGYGSTGV